MRKLLFFLLPLVCGDFCLLQVNPYDFNLTLATYAESCQVEVSGTSFHTNLSCMYDLCNLTEEVCTNGEVTITINPTNLQINVLNAPAYTYPEFKIVGDQTLCRIFSVATEQLVETSTGEVSLFSLNDTSNGIPYWAIFLIILGSIGCFGCVLGCIRCLVCRS